MLFENRREAGERLAATLQRRGYERPVVLGIPRGGVEVAAPIAATLGAELGVVVARKLRAPRQPELGIGAVTSEGAAWINRAMAEAVGADEAYLKQEIRVQAAEAKRREARFDGHRRPSVAGSTVIIVDDGIATGATALAAVRAMRASSAARVVLAAPVGAPDSMDLLRAEADDVVCLLEDPSFYAVGQFYVDFRQLDDDDVIAILASYGRARPAAA